VRCLDASKGRGLFSKRQFAPGEVIFTEMPLISIQHPVNRRMTVNCAQCNRFVGSPADQISRYIPHAGNNDFIPPTLRTTCTGEPIRFSDTVYCPSGCGEVYCSQTCCTESFSQFHRAMCVGPLENDHPLVKFKKHSLEHYDELVLSGNLFCFIAHLACDGREESVDKVQRLMLELGNEFQGGKWEETDTGVCPERHAILVKAFELLKTALLPRAPTIFEPLFITNEFFSRTLSIFERNNVDIDIKSPMDDVIHHAAEGSPDGGEHLRRLLVQKHVQDKEQDDTDMTEMTEMDPKSMPIKDLLDTEWPAFHGTGLYKVAAMMNHSCDPNVQLEYRNGTRQISVVASRRIEASEELSHAYIPDVGDMPVELRKENLKEIGFDCSCIKCKFDLTN